MTTSIGTRRRAATGLGLALTLSMTACGGNLGGGSSDGADFPDGNPISIYVGQDPGGSTDLIGRALADGATADLDVAITVENIPGANGTLAARQLEGDRADGHTLMIFNGSLAYITPLAVSESEAVDIEDFEIVSGLSQDDYVLVTAANSGFETIDDLAEADRSITYGTTGVGTGSQLSQAALFAQADIESTAVPFDGGSPTLTAVLGGQVDVGSIQLGEAAAQIEAGELTPIVTFARERPTYLSDTPTAVEAGYDVEVQQSRAVFAPKDTPQEVIDALRESFQTVFDSEVYQNFNTDNQLTPNEVDGEELREQWSTNLDTYRSMVEEFDIDMGGAQ
ncbi:Bug family tripartite tricarboxylate transporter substrate binding protein [Actinoalloteichus hymeniacidonis]|uniref:Tripartite-type tricarboxylate transporter, receptor component TctC n=1 Tax=Actinoalloteichus hymeniacidonis TaxID=340345 RepID=A0AAC9MZ64_9PSEU|nr:tripartite tricarboxylate transporter substrate binding protein [Actinoalloteichus hymeniacidonis]AOS64035.1 hypothetical protein TL08_16175 [Actinoalloteichus hymeniacidonis]MBB5907903.1 tripartite-type tricarboxylate transporter receptor subunit TctC [Actinoalloteichus hymeniacidonis]